MVTKERYLSTRGIVLAFSSVVIWSLIVETGTRLPYIYTDLADQLRVFVIFPLLVAPLIYFGFIFRKVGQVTGYQQAMNKLKTRKERIKHTLGALFGLLLITGGAAWTSVAFSAWATNLFARKPYAHIYSITEIDTRSGPVLRTIFDLELIDDAGQEVTLRQNRHNHDRFHWTRGEDICVVGRTSLFGTIIDEVTRRLDQCTQTNPTPAA